MVFHSSGKSIASIALLLTITAVLFPALHFTTSAGAWIFWLYSGITFVSALVAVPLAVILFCAALFLLPALGLGTVDVFVVGFILGINLKELFSWKRDNTEDEVIGELGFLGSLLILLPFVLGAFISCYGRIDPLILSTVAEKGGALSALGWLSSELLGKEESIREVARMALAILLSVTVLRASNLGARPRHVFKGLVLGGIFVICWTVPQLLQVQFFIQNRGAFWIETGRFPGSFTDPNAFGVMAGLVVPLLFFLGEEEKRALIRIESLIVLGLASFSGSRTMILALGLWYLYLIYYLLLNEPLKKRTILAAVAVPIGVLIILSLGEPKLNRELQSHSPAPTVTRILQTINWDQAETMFESRVIYSRIALRVWEKSPWVGVGLSRFYELQEENGREIGIELNGWRDNANNFYLQVLSELGLMGLGVILFAFYLWCRALSGDVRKRAIGNDGEWYVHPSRTVSLFRATLGVLIVLLVTGPHTNFPEVRYFAFLIFGVCLSLLKGRDGEDVFGWRLLVFVVTFCYSLLVPFIAFASSRPGVRPQLRIGFYGEELTEGATAAWTSKQARIWVCPHGAVEPKIFVYAGNPGLDSKPLNINFTNLSSRQEHRSVKVAISRSGWTAINISSLLLEPNKPVLVQIEVDRVWSPKETGLSPDPRYLGVMVRLPNFGSLSCF